MKVKITLLTIMALAGAAQAAVTLGFSTSTNISEGWANSAGSKNAAMVWGIIVDVDGDGFDGLAGVPTTSVDGGLLYGNGVAKYEPGILRSGTSGTGAIPGGQALSVTIAGVKTTTDDLIFFSSNLMAIVGSEARATQLAGMAYGAGMAGGGAAPDAYAFVWLDATTLGGAVVQPGDLYGAWTKAGSTAANTATVLPADPGSYTAGTNGPAGMWGADNTAGLKVASLMFGGPEPSTAMLGALGALGLLRRRR